MEADGGLYGAVPAARLAPPRRRRGGAALTALFAASAVAGASLVRRRAVRPASIATADGATLAAAAGATTSPDGAPYEVRVNLREFESVRAWLATNGVDADSTADEVLQWVPDALVLRLWPERVAQGLGPDALGGRVAFNIASCDGDGYFYSSLLVVTDLRGANVSVKVVPDMTQSADRTSTYGVTHFDGLKVRERSLPPQNVPSLTA